MDIPEFGFLRIDDVLKIIPVSKTTWYNGVKSGKYPKSIKITENRVAWRVQDIKALVEQIEREAEVNVEK